MSHPAAAVLNVDDYAPGLYARSRILRQAGFEVIEASTGDCALQLISERRPAIVLLDVNLPNIHGFEVCRRIRMNPALASTAILHISASNTQEHQKIRGLEGGADGYLVEPVDPALLVATVKAFLRTREAETALRRSNEDLERFAYRVSHELNEPLRTLTMHAQLLENRLKGKLGQEELISFQFVQDGVRRMRAFITDLLRYSQATHAGADIRMIDMEGALGEAMFSLSAAIQESGAEITHDPLPVLMTDSRIVHVLQNLLSNAIKYHRPGIAPQVHVSARREGANWLFGVRDNGIGIEAEYRTSIFQVFARLHGKDIPGTGVGLALALRIVETNGGSMWVDSRPGEGSTFHFTIPLRSEANEATA